MCVSLTQVAGATASVLGVERAHPRLLPAPALNACEWLECQNRQPTL